ncbi:MAG: aldehyde dehydrogenase EutE, partial [candidate division KSB1 bacterium]|nr:aldehyde dehydrogenase EutE [candidate division KSB1 bacterium]
MDDKLVSAIVEEVMQRLQAVQPTSAPKAVSASTTNTTGVFDDINEAIEATLAAQKVWMTVKKRDKQKVIAALRKAAHDNAETFAR